MAEWPAQEGVYPSTMKEIGEIIAPTSAQAAGAVPSRHGRSSLSMAMGVARSVGRGGRFGLRQQSAPMLHTKGDLFWDYYDALGQPHVPLQEAVSKHKFREEDPNAPFWDSSTNAAGVIAVIPPDVEPNNIPMQHSESLQPFRIQKRLSDPLNGPFLSSLSLKEMQYHNSMTRLNELKVEDSSNTGSQEMDLPKPLQHVNQPLSMIDINKTSVNTHSFIDQDRNTTPMGDALRQHQFRDEERVAVEGDWRRVILL